MGKLSAAILISICLSALSACANNTDDHILIYPDYSSEISNSGDTVTTTAENTEGTQAETAFTSNSESESTEIKTELSTETETSTEPTSNESGTASIHVDIDENFYCDVCGTRLQSEDPEEETKLIEGDSVLFDEFYDSSFDLNSKEHSNGSKITEDSETYYSNGCELKFQNYSNLYNNARDAKGNSALKLGKSDAIGSFEITIPQNASIVLLKIGKYKDNDSTVIINGREYILTKASNNGEYDEIIIDTSNVKKITVSTTKDHTMCMIRSIEFIK